MTKLKCQINIKTQNPIEKLNIIISALAILGACTFWRDTNISFSIAIGAVIGGANFWALAYILKNIVGESPHKLRLAIFALLKFAALIFVLWAVIKWLPINAVAFLIGLSTVLLSCCLAVLLSDGKTA